MKKYVRPELFYERYEPSMHIADCLWELQYANKDSCHAVADLDDWGSYDSIFTSANSNCLNDESSENYCYHNGAESIKVFVS